MALAVSATTGCAVACLISTEGFPSDRTGKSCLLSGRGNFSVDMRRVSLPELLCVATHKHQLEAPVLQRNIRVASVRGHLFSSVGPVGVGIAFACLPATIPLRDGLQPYTLLRYGPVSEFSRLSFLCRECPTLLPKLLSFPKFPPPGHRGYFYLGLPLRPRNVFQQGVCIFHSPDLPVLVAREAQCCLNFLPPISSAPVGSSIESIGIRTDSASVAVVAMAGPEIPAFC